MRQWFSKNASLKIQKGELANEVLDGRDGEGAWNYSRQGIGGN